MPTLGEVTSESSCLFTYISTLALPEVVIKSINIITLI